MRLAHAVDVIEAQPLQPAFGDQAKNQGMGRPEYVGVFNPKPGKLIDVEKPPVVDLALREPPMGRPVMLPIDEVMEGGDGAGLAGSRLVRRQASFDDIRSLGNARNLALQSRGLVAAGIARPTVPRRQGQQLAS